MDYQKHWSHIYETKAVDDVSWYQAHPRQSLEYIQQTGMALDAAIIDVGAGASTLVDHLVSAQYTDITLLDISAAALEITRQRVGDTEAHLRWIAGDITTVELPKHAYEVWHDRAVFHFLTDPQLQKRYVEQVLQAVKPNGHIIIATFALDGPQACSGLNVVQYDARSLHGVFGHAFDLIDSTQETHQTPWGSEQRFVYCHCRKRGE